METRLAPKELTDPVNEIRECKSIQELLRLVGPHCVVWLDLDNNVMHPAEEMQELGSNQWFKNLLFHANAIKIVDESSAKLVIEIYRAVIQHVKMQLVEKDTATVIQQLQKSGIPVIAITSRSIDNFEETTRELTNLGIDFSIAGGQTSKPLKVSSDKHRPHLRQGILYCDGFAKGASLDALLDTPLDEKEDSALMKALKVTKETHYIMMDDELEKLVSVSETAKKRGIPFLGLRNSHLDERVKAHDMRKTNNTVLVKYYGLFSQKTRQDILKLQLIDAEKLPSLSCHRSVTSSC